LLNLEVISSQRDALVEAQRQKDALAAYRVVYKALGMDPALIHAALPPQGAHSRS